MIPVDHLDLVTAALAAEAGIDPALIDAEQNLAAIDGMESVKVLRAVVQVEDELGIAIPDDFLFETATVADLAELVATLAGRAP